MKLFTEIFQRYRQIFFKTYFTEHPLKTTFAISCWFSDVLHQRLLRYIFWDEISTHLAEKYFTLRLHEDIKFRPGKVRQFCTWYLPIFACIFFEFFLVSMSFYETGNTQISIDLNFLFQLLSLQLCLLFFRK